MLLDRHPLWLEAVERVLERMEISAIGKTTLPIRALEFVETYRPELFVTDIDLDDAEFDGIACVREARARVPELRAVVLSARMELEQIEAAFTAGASAYVTKSAHPDDLASAIRQSFEHSVYLAAFRPARAARPPKVEVPIPMLTRREREILQLVAEGYSNAELAKMLWVTAQTVKFHLSNIYRKINVTNRTGAARWAQLHGMLREADEQDLVA